MRQANREIKERAELSAILEASDVLRLGLSEDGQPYVVPMNFGYEFSENGELSLYLHCANEGRKLDIIAKNPAACFEVDGAHELKPADAPCGYSMNFESIIGFGSIEVLASRTDKIYGLTQIMRHYSAEAAFTFPDAELAAVTVLRLRVAAFTGKRLLKL